MLKEDNTNTWHRSGFLFCVIPLIALFLDFAIWGGLGEGYGAFTYFPLWMSLWIGGFAVVVGIIATLFIWYVLGLIASKITEQHSSITVKALFIAVLLATIILPAILDLSYSRRISGFGYTLEDCRAIDASKNKGVDRNMCIRNTATRMVNNNDPAVDEAFCNSIVESDHTMAYCWGFIAYRRGVSVDFCNDATSSDAKESCVFAIAEKQRNEQVCKYFAEKDIRASCVKRVKLGIELERSKVKK